jgi:hypothetical protein
MFERCSAASGAQIITTTISASDRTCDCCGCPIRRGDKIVHAWRDGEKFTICEACGR